MYSEIENQISMHGYLKKFKIKCSKNYLCGTHFYYYYSGEFRKKKYGANPDRLG